jgi:hypothetical protein
MDDGGRATVAGRSESRMKHCFGFALPAPPIPDAADADVRSDADAVGRDLTTSDPSDGGLRSFTFYFYIQT